jgi:peptidoglycan/LPS O-acetylase OafA/YrhL
MRQKYNEEIQALRGIAIGLVLFSHIGSLFPWETEKWGRWGNGFYVGVDLFLCLSGYVITKSLGREFFASTGIFFWRNVAAFWVRRLYRITPSAWFWLFFPLIFYSLKVGLSGVNLSHLIAALFHVANIQVWQCAFVDRHCGGFTHYWSLSLEEQFYLCLPMLVLLFRRQVHLVLIALVLLQIFIPRPVGSLLFVVKADALMLGVLLALWSETASYQVFNPHLTGSRFRFVAPPLLIACLVGFARYTPVPFFTGMLSIVAAVMVWLCSYSSGYFLGRGWLRNCLVWIGERSFSLYLAAPFAYWLNREVFELLYPGVQFSGRFTLRFLVGAAAWTLAFSEFGYRVIERPFRRRGAAVSAALLRRELEDGKTPTGISP